MSRKLLAMLAVGIIAAGCSGSDEASPAAAGADTAELADDWAADADAVSEPVDVPATTVPQHPFCVAWWDEVSSYRNQWSSTATTDPVASLLLLITAPSELADMFQRLTAEAPSDLVDDLDEIAEYFDGLLVDAVDAVDNPLKVIVGGALAGLQASGPINRVDAYVTSNCPIPDELAAAGQSFTSAACQRVANTDVDAYSDVASFTKFLEDTEAATPDAVEPARELAVLIAEMTPSARFGFEALGRLRYTNGSTGDQLFTQAVKAAVTACVPPDSAAPANTAEDLLARIGPKPGLELSRNLYGRCDAAGLLAPHHNTYRCGGQIEVVDLTSGTIEIIDAEYPLDRRADNRYGWTVRITEHPATGLEQPAWSGVIDVVDFVTRTSYTVDVVDHEAGQPGELGVLFAGDNRLVTYTKTPGDAGNEVEVVTYSAAGDLIATISATELGSIGGSGGVAQSTTVMNESILYIRNPGFLLDPSDGSYTEITTNARLVPKRGPCPTDDYFHQGSFEHYSYFVGVDPLQLIGPVAAMTPVGGGWLDRGPSRGHDGWRLYEIDDWGDEVNRQLSDVRSDATERWFISNDVISDARVTFGWITVTNRSGQLIVVDPATGTEADPVVAPVDLIARIADSRNVNHVFRIVEHLDQVAGLVFLDGGDRLEIVDLAPLCPTDWDAVANALPTSTTAQVRAFSGELADAAVRGDIDWMFDRLHPNVRSLYPAEECRATVSDTLEAVMFEPVARIAALGAGQSFDFDEGRIVEFGRGYRVWVNDDVSYTVSLDVGGPYWFVRCD